MLCLVAMVVLLLGTGPAWAMATEDLTEAETAANSNAYAEAVRLIEAEDYKGAITLLEGVVALTPDHADAWSRLGFSKRKLGAHEPALVAYSQALRLQPEHLGANEYLGELYIEMGRLDLARERLAVLDRACAGACEEYVELKQQIEAAAAGSGGAI